MARMKWDDVKKTPAQLAWEKEMAEMQVIWDLLSPSQQERIAMTEGKIDRFAEYFAHLCLKTREARR